MTWDGGSMENGDKKGKRKKKKTPGEGGVA